MLRELALEPLSAVAARARPALYAFAVAARLAVRVLNTSELEVFLPVRTLFRERCGTVTDFKGDYYSPYQPHLVATNGKIHEDLLKVVNNESCMKISSVTREVESFFIFYKFCQMYSLFYKMYSLLYIL